jgi:hypothetical protein
MFNIKALSAYKMSIARAVGMLLLSGLAMLPLNASAADYYVDITNNTGYTVFYIYVSPDKSDSWEEDVLGAKVLSSGETRRINLYGYKSPVFDIRLVDEDDDTYTFWDVDVSEDDIVATLDDLDSK